MKRLLPPKFGFKDKVKVIGNGFYRGQVGTVVGHSKVYRRDKDYAAAYSRSPKPGYNDVSWIYRVLIKGTAIDISEHLLMLEGV